MATERQRKAADKFVENRGKSVSAAMREAGYSHKTAKDPKNLTESKSWQALLDHFLPEDMLLEALQDDIKSKPDERKQEHELAFKVRGRMKDSAKVTDEKGVARSTC